MLFSSAHVRRALSKDITDARTRYRITYIYRVCCESQTGARCAREAPAFWIVDIKKQKKQKTHTNHPPKRLQETPYSFPSSPHVRRALSPHIVYHRRTYQIPDSRDRRRLLSVLYRCMLRARSTGFCDFGYVIKRRSRWRGNDAGGRKGGRGVV